MRGKFKGRAQPASMRLVHAAAEALESRRMFTVTLISAASGGGAGNNISGGTDGTGDLTPSVSADGRYVAFISQSSNLVAGDNNNVPDVFVRDTQTGATQLVSVGVNGAGGNGISGASGLLNTTGPQISGDGRYVVFASSASNLVSSDGNGADDIFLRDLQSGTTTLITHSAGSTSSAGMSTTVNGQPVISRDGDFVAFTSNATNLLSSGTDADGQGTDVYLYNVATGATKQLSLPAGGGLGGGASDGNASSPSISSDGRYVAFLSTASDLVSGMQTGLHNNVFVRDTQADTTVLASAGTSAGTGGNDDSASPAISGNGRAVAFLSRATNIVAGITDTNADAGDGSDVFVRNLATNVTSLASVSTTANTAANAASGPPAISDDGTIVAFESAANNLVSGVTDSNDSEDVFVRNLTTGATTLVSSNSSGTGVGTTASGTGSEAPVLSAGGRYVGFISLADDLVAGGSDINPLADVYVRDREAGTTTLVSVAPSVSGAMGQTSTLALSASGNLAVFTTNAAISGADVNMVGDVYAATLPGGDDGSTTVPPSPPPPSGAGIDLSDAVTLTGPVSAVAGTKVKASATVTVTNVGPDTLNRPVVIKLYASTASTLDSTATAVMTFTRRLKLAAGKSKAVKVPLAKLPALADGQYMLLAEIDPANALTETNETNNVAASTATIQLAAPFVDLSATSLAVPATVQMGKKAGISLGVTNGGNIVAAGRVNVVLTLPGVNGAAATPVASVPVKLKLKPSQAKVLKLKFLVPTTLGAGPFNLTATLAPVAPLADTDTTNDAITSTTTFTVA